MSTLPYVTSPGNISKALNAIRAASVPERVSQDFVKTILKIPGGSGDQMTTFLKKLGFADSSGRPTELYSKFRNKTSSGKAVADALKQAYEPLSVRNEFWFQLGDEELLGLLVEETGQSEDSNPVKLTNACIKGLKEFADFSASPDKHVKEEHKALPPKAPQRSDQNQEPKIPAKIGLNLGYTINLNLPASSDPAVFNAIFKSLKEHLLSDDDA